MTTPVSASTTLASVIWPHAAGRSALGRSALLVVVGSIFVALCAQIRIPLEPVPITGQTFAVLVVGAAYGWRLGASTMLLYLAEGAVGIPVFAGFSGGFGVITGATGGRRIRATGTQLRRPRGP